MAPPYQVPAQPGRWRAGALALLVHLALLAFLWIGIRWHSETPLTVEAEIWDPYVREAAPPPEPQPQPEPEPPKPAPTPPPSPKIKETPVAEPDIALEKKKEKKRKEQEKKEREEREKQARLEQEERAKKEKLARQKKDADDKKKADDKAAAQRRQEDLKRMMNQAAGSGGAGDAARSQGPRGVSDYAGKLGARIRSNTIFDVPPGLSGNPAVEYTVELLPDGSVRDIRRVTPSGLPGFDEAVRQAIDSSQPFPPDKDGKVPGSFTFTHKPKDR